MGLPAEDILRQLLGEVVQPGEAESDSMFTDAEIEDFLLRARRDLERAAYFGWLAKAANYSNLINVGEGNATRSMSDLHKHAMDMVKYYESSNAGLVQGRTRVGRIRRRFG